MIAARATSLAIRTAGPGEPSFGRLIEAVRLQAEANGAPFAEAVMRWIDWAKLMRYAQTSLRAKVGFTFEFSNNEAAMPRDVLTALAVRLGYTNDSHIVVELLDGDNKIVAFAEFTADQFSAFIGQGCDLLEIVSKGGLATVECAGAA